jgi:hypothetical protein
MATRREQNKMCAENPYYEVGLSHPLNGIFASKKRRLLHKSENRLAEFESSTSVNYRSPDSSHGQ